MMKVLSLFDGISCGQVALNNVGIIPTTYYACEIDKYAKAITQYQYPSTIQLGDVFDIDFKSLGDMDLVIGGFPCTNISIAKRDREVNLEGEAGKLFHRLLDAIKETNAKYFLVENNASIHKDVKDAVSDLLGVQPIQLDSCLFSAQQRKRLYWTNIPPCNTFRSTVYPSLQSVLQSGIAYQHQAHCLTARYGGAVFWNSIIKKQRTMVLEQIDAYDEKTISVVNGKVYLPQDNKYHTLDVPDGSYRPRKLTPVECERLQTLPDNYTAKGDFNGVIKEVSDTQRYKAIGNGWTIKVIEFILAGLNG
jgi:DNA (cytosine-5)-methyltransferase 3A